MSEDIIEKTVLNATARIYKTELGYFKYEVVFGVLPMDDVFRRESKNFKSSSQCLACMITDFPEHIKSIMNSCE